RNEHGVEAEAFRAARLLGDPAFEGSRAAVFDSLGRDRHELADVARPAALAFDSFELLERTLRLAPGRPAGRTHSWAAAEAFDLDARVLAEHPPVGLALAPELGLRKGVLVVRLAGLGRIVAGAEQLELPAERMPQLAQLVLVRRG